MLSVVSETTINPVNLPVKRKSVNLPIIFVRPRFYRFVPKRFQAIDLGCPAHHFDNRRRCACQRGLDRDQPTASLVAIKASVADGRRDMAPASLDHRL